MLTAVVLMALTASARERVCFDKDWRFILADTAAMASPDYNDSFWRRLDVPHDWAIEGDFYAGNPSGAGGGALPGGVGWYRKRFFIDRSPLTIDHSPLTIDHWFLEFDGVYMNSTVYVNGEKVGFRPYGYSSFEYDITPYVCEGENVVAVRVDNSDQPNSRWYSGCGIYRHVWLTRTGGVHVKHWGVHAASSMAKGKGRLDITVEVEDSWGMVRAATMSQHSKQGAKPGADEGAKPRADAPGTAANANGQQQEGPRQQGWTVENTLIGPDGVIVGRSKGAKSSMTVAKPKLWSCETPYIYKLRTCVKVGGKVVDEVETVTGFRDFRFDAETGFWLNGRNFKLNGVCEHHDFGCLGAAVYEDALHRKLSRLKAMGVNAIRSSHNPPAPELLAMCDTMGLIVMDESFDMWRRRKTENDYARFFDEWHERDLTDLVLRDRNHPCILMWSIGNEVLEQWSSAEADTLTLEQANLILNAGHDASTLAKDGELSVQSLLTQHLAEIVRRYDRSRPITAGCNEPSPNNHLFKSGTIDIIGFNYHHQWVKDVPQNFPGKPFIFSESVSALQTRGYYMMPSDSIYRAPKEWWLPYTDPSFKCSAYDNMSASWGSTHEETWDVVKHTPYVGGQFIWTGFDYIGEPTPYGFPARSSYFGVIDLAGFPKDSYYMYQSEWTEKPMLHLFPHWNWMPGEEIDLWCYYNKADEVELFVNGKSQGVKSKGEGYHVSWRVNFAPGEIRAVSRKDGKAVCEQVIRTAGQSAAIRLTMDYQGHELCFVCAEIVDAQGNLCPWAENEVFFVADGEGRIVGTDNGCQTSMERFTAPQRKAFFGKCMAVVKGHGTLTAKSIGLKDAMISF